MVRMLVSAVWLALPVLGSASTLPDGLELVPGVHVPGQQPDGNSVLIDTGEGLVIVDSGRHPAHAQRLIDAVEASGHAPAALFNTHWHLDHVGGNPLLRARWPGLPVYGTSAIDEALHGFLADYRRQLQEQLAGAPGDAQRAAMQAEVARIDAGAQLRPTIVVDAGSERTIGGRVLHVGVAEHAATAADLWVFDPQSRTLIAGDLVTFPVPFLDTACATGWQQALRLLAAQPFERVVPGHGPVLDRAGFERYADAFDDLLACAAGDADAATCGRGWIASLGPLLPAEQHAFAGEMLDYYVGVLRAPVERRERYCQG